MDPINYVETIGGLFMDYFIKMMYAILTTCVIFALLVLCTMSSQALAAEVALPNWQEETFADDGDALGVDFYKKGVGNIEVATNAAQFY